MDMFFEKYLKFFRCFSLLIFLQLGFLTVTAEAVTQRQTISVNGVVVDEGNVPVAGAYVVEKGTDNGTSTDSDGKFLLTVSKGSELTVSFMGFVSQTIPASSSVRVVLIQDNIYLNETVVVGYGTQRVATITGSVAQVNSDKLNVVPVTNTTQTLAGRLPGLITKQTSGLPGQDNAGFSIRGYGSPLVIIDGVEGDLASLDPGQIESISILKDGSGSIYGARAGNGVVLVTTKSGVNQPARVSANVSWTFQSNIVTTRPADSYQRALYQNDIYMNKGGEESRKPYLDEELELFKKGTNRCVRLQTRYCTSFRIAMCLYRLTSFKFTFCPYDKKAFALLRYSVVQCISPNYDIFITILNNYFDEFFNYRLIGRMHQTLDILKDKAVWLNVRNNTKVLIHKCCPWIIDSLSRIIANPIASF